MDELSLSKQFYRVKEASESFGISVNAIYKVLDDESLNVDQRRIKSYVSKTKSGNIVRSMRLITQQGMQDIFNLINKEEI